MSLIEGAEFKRLREALPDIVKQSRVPEPYIHESCLNHVTGGEADFIRNYPTYKKSPCAGYVRIGGGNTVKRFNYMAGAFIRNFTDARVFTLEQCLTLDNDQMKASVILIPDFCPDLIEAKPMVSWKLQQVYSFLITRQSLGKMNVVYLHDRKMANRLLGTSIVEHLENDYICGKG